MNKKLTLSVDETIIERAKTYAKEQDMSLSQVIERYLRKITIEHKSESTDIHPDVQALLGSIELPADFDLQKAKREYLEQKYL